MSLAPALNFELPEALRAVGPPESRGLARDEVRLMVAHGPSGQLNHTRFNRIADFLGPDDIVVVNTSATLAAAVVGVAQPDGPEVVVHFSTCLATQPGRPEHWVVEVRWPDGASSQPWPKRPGPGGPPAPPPGHIGNLGGDPWASLRLGRPYHGSRRLWEAEVRLPDGHASGVPGWLATHGHPVRYSYVRGEWPLSYYQNVFAIEPGSAEMPSAGRPFSHAIVTALVAQGTSVAPIVLHTGVSSLEQGETPYPERAKVPASTARRVNAVRASGGRVVAVGTTVCRALESAFDDRTGTVVAYDGWADIVITPERGVKVVHGLVTGWHEPEASHLMLLEAVAGRDMLERAYRSSLEAGYLWHEFGDSALFLPVKNDRA